MSVGSGTDSDGRPQHPKERVAHRLQEADLSAERFITVENDGKASTDHTLRQASDVTGNYGVYAGRGLVIIDDDTDPETTIPGIDDLQETFSVGSPNGTPDGIDHRYYHVGNAAEKLQEEFDVANPVAEWGEVRVKNQYVVGPGSTNLDGSVRDEYVITNDAPIATLSPYALVGALRASGYGSVDSTHRDATHGREETASGSAGASNLSDSGLLEKARSAENGGKFQRLWNGDTADYPSHSEADQALCNHLAFWTGNDKQRIDRLFRQSGLCRDKWTSRQDYRERTISKAIQATTDTYDPAKSGSTAANPTHKTDEPASSWDEVKQLFDSNENGSTTDAYAVAASILTDQYDFVAVRESNEIYHYVPEKGYYVRKGATFINELVEQHIPSHANDSRIRNIRSKVRARSYVEVDDFQPPEGKVNVENGVIDLSTWESDPHDALEPHSADYYFTARLNVEYDPDAGDGGVLADALETAILQSRERQKFLEFVGHTLEMWTTDQEKAMVFVGPSGSGKSTIQEVVKELFGTPPTVTALAPHQLADSRFDTAVLRNAALNTVNDINGGKIEDTGTLKRIISGEPTKMEAKHKDAHFGSPKAKHLFTANWMPRLVGQDDAVYRRFLIIEFTNQIPDEKQDTDHKKRLVNDPAVRQVLLNRALEARSKMRERDGFTNDRTRSKTRKLWDSWRDSHKRFLYTHFDLTGDPDDAVEKESYWRAYDEFAGLKGYERISNRAVTKALQWVPEVRTGGDDDHYHGLRWKEEKGGAPSQHSRKSKVRSWVAEFSTPRGGADIDAIVSHAEDNGVDGDAVRRDIENMLETGELMKTSSDTIRLT